MRFTRTAIFAFTLFAFSVCSLTSAQFQERTPPAVLTVPVSGFNTYLNPAIAGDGAGTWVAVCKAQLNDGLTHYVAARSTDNGTTWSPRVVLDPEVQVLDGQWGNYAPAVACDGQGVWIAIWSAWIIGNDSLRHTFVSRSSDNGATWSDPVMLNLLEQGTTMLGPDGPHIATDRAGNWIAVFAGWTGPVNQGILAARSSDNGLSWSAPMWLENQAPLSDEPHIATDGAGTWIAVWRGGSTDININMARSRDNGATWGEPDSVSTHEWVDRFPAIVSDGAGHWVVVWTSSSGSSTSEQLRVARSHNDGDNWTTWNAIYVTDYLSMPSLATDSAGNWVATWGAGLGSSLGNLVARSSDNGATWTAPEALAEGDGGFSSPAVASDGAGSWIGVWSQDSQSNVDNILYTRWSSLLAPDRDGDNLSDTDETNAGSSSDTWDTDGDSLSDEEEVNTHSTSPLLADTDGDGVWDVIEISLGTDPNDAFDFPVLPLSREGWLAVVFAGFGAAALMVRRRAHPQP